MREKLEKRFKDFLTRIGIEKYHFTLWHDVEAHYAESHRHYHTLAHIDHMLYLFDDIKENLSNPDEVEAAIWYHDLIYRTPDTLKENTVLQNEFESALRANEVLASSKIDTNLVFNMIIMTDGHKAPETSDEAYFHDLDLAILGYQPPIYETYADGIRREYRSVPERVYAIERAAVLDAFLQKDFIYQTPHFRCLFDQQARINIENEQAKLLFVIRQNQRRLTHQPH